MALVGSRARWGTAEYQNLFNASDQERRGDHESFHAAGTLRPSRPRRSSIPARWRRNILGPIGLGVEHHYAQRIALPARSSDRPWWFHARSRSVSANAVPNLLLTANCVGGALGQLLGD